MIKYIVTWVVCQMVSDPCPDAGRTDQFGRVSNSWVSCAVYHAHAEYSKQTRDFQNRDSAISFHKEVVKEAEKYMQNVLGANGVYKMYFASTGAIKDVKIDSVKIK